jgi:4-coumarate--CoA ligase
MPNWVQHPVVKDYDLSVIRFLMSGAAPLSAEINHHLFRLFPNAQIGQAYGNGVLPVYLTIHSQTLNEQA